MNEEKNPKNQIQVDIAPEQAEGVYANAVLITHSDSEFILDFARQLPGQPKARIHSRVIMNPKSTKLFFKALEDNIKKYESKFGTIKLPEMPPIMMQPPSEVKH